MRVVRLRKHQLYLNLVHGGLIMVLITPAFGLLNLEMENLKLSIYDELDKLK